MSAAWLVLGALVILWIGWRLASQRTVLPCPSGLSWLVELENPVVRAVRSANVVRRLAPRPGDRVMDVGCGPGRVSVPLARAVGPQGEVIAVDVQSAMLAKVACKAEAAGWRHLRAVRADLSRESAPASGLDGAVLVMALGEIPEPGRVLGSVQAALRPGGRLVVAESLSDPHYLPVRQVRGLATAAGFRERDTEGGWLGDTMVLERPAGDGGKTGPAPGGA